MATIRYERGFSIGEMSSELVVPLIQDVRKDIVEYNDDFMGFSLGDVLGFIDSGSFEIREGSLGRRRRIVIDLKEAKDAVTYYRNNSEGGCRSCTSLGTSFARIGVNSPEDMDFFSWCYVREGSNSEEVMGGAGYGCGFSPMVKRYYSKPCDSWTPKMSPSIEMLIKEVGE